MFGSCLRESTILTGCSRSRRSEEITEIGTTVENESASYRVAVTTISS